MALSTLTRKHPTAPAPKAAGAPDAAPSPAPDGANGAVPVAAHLRPRRSPRLVAAGVLLACLGGLGGAVAYQQASHSNQVVVVQREVARGAVVHPSDLAVVTIGPAPGVRTLPAGRLDELVGKQALVDLPAGSLVAEGSVGTQQLPPGSAELGLKLAAGRIPNQAMPAGTPVQLVEVGSEKNGSAPGGTLVADASVVTAPSTLPDGSSQVLDVAVSQAQAQRVADLAARDLLVVVRKAGA